MVKNTNTYVKITYPHHSDWFQLVICSVSTHHLILLFLCLLSNCLKIATHIRHEWFRKQDTIFKVWWLCSYNSCWAFWVLSSTLILPLMLLLLLLRICCLLNQGNKPSIDFICVQKTLCKLSRLSSLSVVLNTSAWPNALAHASSIPLPVERIKKGVIPQRNILFGVEFFVLTLKIEGSESWVCLQSFTQHSHTRLVYHWIWSIRKKVVKNQSVCVVGELKSHSSYSLICKEQCSSQPPYPRRCSFSYSILIITQEKRYSQFRS